jgi:GrpB-like predicted nucleotidyltransferase (UPF0157 family)
MTEPVRIVAHDPAWPERFKAEKALLDRVIGEWATGGIHHVGSTAVPGLAAKPVIDILVGVDGLAQSRAVFEPLAGAGCLYAPHRVEEMHWFCKPDPSRRTHHLHRVPTGSKRFEPDDREAYSEAKAAFIDRVMHLSSQYDRRRASHSAYTGAE